MNNAKLIANRYSIDKCIGNGTFGNVYKGQNNKNNEYVAIKLEDKRTSYRLLKRETSILKYLYEHQCRFIPCVFWFGEIGDSMGLIMTYYEGSLNDYINTKDITENKRNAIMIQCIRILESVHTNFVIHRDIKPQNFMLKNGELYLIDFGLATFYVDENRMHTSNSINGQIAGTPKYISHFIHDGDTPSRRDDIISLGYMYIFLYAHELPWDSVYNDDTHDATYTSEIHTLHTKNIQRKQMKSIENIVTVCELINDRIPVFIKNSYNIEYIVEPNYDFLCSIFAANNKINI
jgi:serine/threonine protein kinase